VRGVSIENISVHDKLPWPNRERARVRAGARFFSEIHMEISKKRRAPARTRARSRLGHGSGNTPLTRRALRVGLSHKGRGKSARAFIYSTTPVTGTPLSLTAQQSSFLRSK
jgi:hypothetical protein